jgi:hypothetical protein
MLKTYVIVGHALAEPRVPGAAEYLHTRRQSSAPCRKIGNAAFVRRRAYKDRPSLP